MKTFLLKLLLASTAVLTMGTLQAKNVIFFIGDGMGPEQVLAARYFAGEPLSFEYLPYQAECTTYSASSSVTDSAAAATALATAVKVNNGVISMAYPGDGSELETLLEYFQSEGKEVGLVTTTYLTHATPAAFGAHEPSRNNLAEIGFDYLNQTVPNVLFGGGGNGMTVSSAENAGYTVATDAASFMALNPGEAFLCAQFGSSHLPYEFDYLDMTYPYPHLSDMVLTALDALSDDPDGFFLMIEGGRIDHASHDNHLERAIHETLEFSHAVEVALNWAAGREDTLILVTADHETGGLDVLTDNGPGAYPTVSWSTGGHSATNVPVYAWGMNAERVTGTMDNTDMFEICTADTTPVQAASSPQPRNGAMDVPLLDVTLSWTAGVGAQSHDVYFNDDPDALLLLSSGQVETELGLQPLSPATTYYWRVDERDGAGGVATGDLWSFSTLVPPSSISDPKPQNGAVEVPVDVILSWTAGAQADTHTVYFGTSENPPLIAEQSGTTFDPGILSFNTVYYWRIDENNDAGTTEGNVYNFTTAAVVPPQTIWASGENTANGVIIENDWSATITSDNNYEVIQEVLNVPNKNGYSILDHTWTFTVQGGSSAEFYVEAWHNQSSDGDDFVFSYSQDGATYTDMVTVSKTTDTDTPQVFVLPDGFSSGTVYVRVQDTDHIKKNNSLDVLYVDEISIVTSSGAMPYFAASYPSPADGASEVALDPVLTWTAGEGALGHNVYFGEDLEYLELVSENQSGTTYTPGSLSELTTHYWRIDEVRSGGLVATGLVWSFTTTYSGVCVPSTLEVASVVTTTVRGSAGMKFGQVTVTIRDNCGNPVTEATVTGAFTGDFNEVASGQTDMNGEVTLTTSTQVKKPSFGFIVSGVTHAELVGF